MMRPILLSLATLLTTFSLSAGAAVLPMAPVSTEAGTAPPAAAAPNDCVITEWTGHCPF